MEIWRHIVELFTVFADLDRANTFETLSNLTEFAKLVADDDFFRFQTRHASLSVGHEVILLASQTGGPFGVVTAGGAVFRASHAMSRVEDCRELVAGLKTREVVGGYSEGRIFAFPAVSVGRTVLAVFVTRLALSVWADVVGALGLAD